MKKLPDSTNPNHPTAKHGGLNAEDKELLKLIEKEYGPILINDGDRSILNQVAFAAWFTETHKVAWRWWDRSYFRYMGDVWRKVDGSILIKLMSQMLKEKLADVVDAPELLARRTSGLLKNLLKLVEAVSILGEPPAPSLALLPVENGVLDLTGDVPVLRDYKPDDWFTEKIPFAYKADAKCDRFLKELIEPALSNLDEVPVLQRDLGRQLFAGNYAQIISILQGEGGSGKSVLISIIEAIIGPSRFGYLRSHQLTGRFETHGFLEKSTLVGKDVLPDYLNNHGAAVIKSLTGADRVQVEQKYGGKHDMRGLFYVIITTNSRLKIKLQGDMSAWKRRLVIYEFSRKIPDKIIHNFDQVLLQEEGDGILKFLIDGYLAHRVELREHGTLQLTEAQQQRVNNWLEESDALRAFARQNIRAGLGSITVHEAWAAFTSFARARGWKLPTETQFQRELPAVMLELFSAKNDNHVRRNAVEVHGYKNVTLITQE